MGYRFVFIKYALFTHQIVDFNLKNRQAFGKQINVVFILPSFNFGTRNILSPNYKNDRKETL